MSSHQTVNSEPNSSLTDTDIATRHPTATAFTVLNKPVGKYFLTTNDDFFPCTDVSHLLPHSNVIQRVIRANDDDYPEIWLTLDPVSNSMRMGTSISYRPRPTDTGKEMKGVSSTVHMIARDPFDQQTQTRTRDSWNDDTMSRGALGADTPLTGDKSVRSQIIALIPSIQDDEKGLIEIEDGVRRRVGMVQDYVVRPRLTSGNYHLVQDGTTQSTSVGNINNANDDFVTSYTEDPAGTLDIAYNCKYSNDPSDHLSIRSQACPSDIRAAKTNQERMGRYGVRPRESPRSYQKGIPKYRGGRSVVHVAHHPKV